MEFWFLQRNFEIIKNKSNPQGTKILIALF